MADSDSQELVEAIEHAFQIHLADGEVERVATVGELYDLVRSKLPLRASARCLTSTAFYRTRKAIAEALGLERKKIAPATPFDEIFPPEVRRRKWESFEKRLGLRLPALQVYWGVFLLCVTGCIGVAVAAGIYGRIEALPLFGFAVIGLMAGASLACSPWLATAAPAATVGDLARQVASMNHARLASQIGGFAEREVWESICSLISIQTGIDRLQIKRDSRIVDDLRID